MPDRSLPSERGIALLTALMIVSMATIAAVAFTTRQKLSMRLTANVLASDQAYMYALGGEYWARGQLARDNEKDRKNGRMDSLDEDWAKPLPATAIESGTIEATLQDATARFNLNNLYLPPKPDPKEQAMFNRQIAYFERLLDQLGIDAKIVQPVLDWIDGDIDARFPDGGEDVEYLNLDTPYRTANRRLISITELRRIKGVTEGIYEKLAPYVTALPESTPLNINTADAVLIQALVNSADTANVEALLEERKEEPFRTKKEFLDRLKAAMNNKIQNPNDLEALIDVASVYFLARTDVQVDRIHMTLTSLIYKNPAGMPRTLIRSRGGL